MRPWTGREPDPLEKKIVIRLIAAEEHLRWVGTEQMSLSPKDVETVVKNVVAATMAYDPWTSCEYDYDGDRIDRLLTHASLIQQLVHVCGPVPGDLSLPQVADKVWEELFVKSECCPHHADPSPTAPARPRCRTPLLVQLSPAPPGSWRCRALLQPRPCSRSRCVRHLMMWPPSRLVP